MECLLYLQMLTRMRNQSVLAISKHTVGDPPGGQGRVGLLVIFLYVQEEHGKMDKSVQTLS